MTPWTVACQASLSLAFSRQEYCSGLPFPSPGDLPHPGIETGPPTLQQILYQLAIREAKKELVAPLCPTLFDSMDHSPPGFSVHGILQARILEWVAIPFSSRSSQPRDQTQVSPLQVNSLLSEPPGKPKNTGVGSLSLLQQIFPTQESNWGPLFCSPILNQLSYEGSPYKLNTTNYCVC